MPVASIVSKRTQIARESAPGTGVAPNLFLQGLNIRLLPANTRGEVRPSGSTMRTARPSIQEWSTFSLADGSYVDYNSILYVLASMCGVPTTTTPGGGTDSREHAMRYNPDGLNTRPVYTMVAGYRGGTAEKSIRNVFASIGFGFSRTGAPTISGSGFGRKLDFTASLDVNEVNVVTITGAPDGGTFTITVAGQTTADIAYDAAAAAVQSALEALSNVAPGDVTVTGSAGGPYTLTWGGALANTNLTVTSDGASLTGGTDPAATTTTTQQGGVTTVPVKAVQAPEWDVYVNSDPGDIGTTKVRPYSAEFSFGGLTVPDWVIDSETESYDDEKLQVPDLSLNLVMRNDSTARTLYDDLLAGETKYVRFKATGPIIEGALPYLIQLDTAVQAAENIGQFGDEGGAETIPFPLTIVSDADFAAGGFDVLVRNTLTSL